MGGRISDMRLNGKPIEPGKTYKVAGWAPVAEGAEGRTDLGCCRRAICATARSSQPVRLNQPTIKGVAGNPGIA